MKFYELPLVSPKLLVFVSTDLGEDMDLNLTTTPDRVGEIDRNLLDIVFDRLWLLLLEEVKVWDFDLEFQELLLVADRDLCCCCSVPTITATLVQSQWYISTTCSTIRFSTHAKWSGVKSSNVSQRGMSGSTIILCMVRVRSGLPCPFLKHHLAMGTFLISGCLIR